MEFDTYLVTQASLSGEHSTPEVVAAAIDGGVDVVQVREKDATARDRLQVARTVREQTRAAGVPMVVNDRVDIAAAADADGVHLGDDDLPVAAAREQLDADAVIGRSVSTPEAAREAEAAGADYLGVGAVYATGSKADIDDEEYDIGLDPVRDIDEAVDIPFVGIGGITAENAAEVVAAGADGVAVITAVTAAGDPARATRKLGEAVAEGRQRRESADLGGTA
jgi:thiamine-phosphate pyrophosphorylase